MQQPPAGLLTALIPVFGLGFLLLCMSGGIRPRACPHPGGLLTDAPPGDRTIAPASVNPTRLLMLEGDYRQYRIFLARSRRAGSGAERARWGGCLQEARDGYNEISAETDPSVFRSCRLPRRL